MENANGIKIIELCQVSDLKIVNGRFGTDYKEGMFTCVNKNEGQSCIDYVILSYTLFPYITNFCVGELD